MKDQLFILEVKKFDKFKAFKSLMRIINFPFVS